MDMEHLEEIGLFKARGDDDPPAAAAPAAASSAAAAAPDAPPASKKEAKGTAKAAAKATAPAAPAGPPPEEKTAAELARMTKDERTAYHLARRATGSSGAAKPKPQALSKAERRAMQDAQRKVKDDKANAELEGDELLKELILQGLTEDQAKVVMQELEEAKVEEEDDDDDDEPEDLKASVRKWMCEVDLKDLQEPLSDFNLKVRFQGHVESTPPDHIRAMLQVLVDQACADSSFGSLKQPMAVAKAVEPALVRWAKILEPLYGKIDDVLEATDSVISSIRESVDVQSSVKAESKACIVVGFLMAVRSIDMVEDEDLLTGCRRAGLESVVMDKFISFLEEAVEDDDDDDDDGD